MVPPSPRNQTIIKVNSQFEELDLEEFEQVVEEKFKLDHDLRIEWLEGHNQWMADEVNWMAEIRRYKEEELSNLKAELIRLSSQYENNGHLEKNRERLENDVF